MTSDYRRPVNAAALAHNFRVFADADCVAEPLYAALSRAIAGDADVLSLAMQAPHAQRRPVLLFAAVHDLLLAGTPHALAAFYRSCVGDDVRLDVERAAAPFGDFCSLQHDALVDLLATRTVQTNEVGRSAGLDLALSAIGSDVAIALIDVGCSAGLNLLVDRYRFAFERADRSVRESGPESDVVIRASLLGADPCEPDGGTAPSIVRRIGIDLAPLDVRDARDARWLRACVWPTDAERHRRLAAAIALARTTPLDLRTGPADVVLEDVLAGIESTVRPVVFHSWVVSYFDHGAKRRFVDAARAMVVERGGAWVSAEGPGVVPGLPVPDVEPGADATRREATLWHLTTRVDGRAVTRVVARSHPHGRWIEWLA